MRYHVNDVLVESKDGLEVDSTHRSDVVTSQLKMSHRCVPLRTQEPNSVKHTCMSVVYQGQGAKSPVSPDNSKMFTEELQRTQRECIRTNQ